MRKLRISSHERKQEKKKRQNTEKTAEIVEEVSFVDPAEVERRKEEELLMKRLSGLNTELFRQLSDSSQHLAKRCVTQQPTEEGERIQKVLLFVQKAHRNGIISLRDKVELKDLLLSKGSDAVVLKLKKYPGGANVLRTQSSVRNPHHEASRYHVFQQLGSYSITMFVSDSLKMENALKEGNDHCVVRSEFVTIQANKLAGQLHRGTKQVLEEPNAGGKSFNSEALSFETLQAMFGAVNLITEMSVRYTSRHCSMVDFICEMYGHQVGVSVTRAMHFKGAQYFTEENAERLIKKKLGGLNRASLAVCDENKFDRQILHVWAQSQTVAELVRNAFNKLVTEEPQENVTICLTTVADRIERFVFNNEPAFEYIERDPFGFENLKRQLRKQESELVPKLIQAEITKKNSVDSAFRKMYSSGES